MRAPALLTLIAFLGMAPGDVPRGGREGPPRAVARRMPRPVGPWPAMAEGYLAARPDGRGGVDKGALFTLAGIVVEGSKTLTAERLGLLDHAGQPASAARLRAISAAVKAYLLDHGHPFAEASLDFTVRGKSPAVDLRVVLSPGPGYKYGGTKHSGSRTKPVTLERLSLLQYGEDFSETRRQLAAGKLARTGYYDAVIPGILYRDSSRNLIYPSLTLADRKGNRLSGILGYDSEKGGEGLDGYLDIHLINMRGTARDLDFTFESKSTGEGPPEKEVRFAYVEPWLLGTPLGGRLVLDILLQDSVYEERNADFSLFQDMGFQSRYSVHFGAQDNRDILANLRSSAITTGLGLIYDARDRVPATLRGVRLEGKVTGLRRELVDSSYYLAQGTGSAGLWANRGRWVAHALLTAGGDWPLEARANRGELFELGGANTIRGYREKEFLTDLYGYANLELQFLLAPASRAALFAVPGLVNRLGRRRPLAAGIRLRGGAGGRRQGVDLRRQLCPQPRPVGWGWLRPPAGDE